MSKDLQRRYQELHNALSRIGYFRRGTLLKRFIACGKPGCAFGASPPRLHGPYYQWTRKVAGKTVTVLLSSQQAALLEGWIATGRELDRIIAQMERLSLRATDRLLNQLPPRQRRRPHLGQRHPRPLRLGHHLLRHHHHIARDQTQARTLKRRP